MSRARHSSGGGIGAVPDNVKVQNMGGADSNTAKEAERRKRGGAVKGKMPMMVHGGAPKHHGNRPGRKSGGAVGADSSPMTQASRLTSPEGLSRDASDKSG
jgi:hypothetical protein